LSSLRVLSHPSTPGNSQAITALGKSRTARSHRQPFSSVKSFIFSILGKSEGVQVGLAVTKSNKAVRGYRALDSRRRREGLGVQELESNDDSDNSAMQLTVLARRNGDGRAQGTQTGKLLASASLPGPPCRQLGTRFRGRCAAGHIRIDDQHSSMQVADTRTVSRVKLRSLEKSDATREPNPRRVMAMRSSRRS